MKTCNVCKRDLPLEEYHRKGNGYRDRCKQCAKAYHRTHYLANKDRYLDQAKASKRELQRFIDEELKSGSCLDCGRNFPPVAMDFHHLGDKDIEIARLKGMGNKNRILEEVEKCVLLCAVCHRLRHHAPLA